MATDNSGLTATPTGNGQWRWSWRAPWGAIHVAPNPHKSEQAALAAGRKWLARQRR